MQYRFSRRAQRTDASLIRRMFNYAADVPDHVSLGVGIPPFEMPWYVTAGLTEALQTEASHINKYTLGKGLPPLNEAVAERLKRKGIVADPKKEILTTAGAAGGIFCTFMALIDEGDEVVIPSPAYANHIDVTVFAGGVPVTVPLMESQNYELDHTAIENAITEKTKAIVLCNPNNPTGTVYTEEALRTVGQIAKARNLILFEDNAYEFLTYGGKRHFSLASVPEYRDNVVAFFTSSKEHAMTGLRVGWVVANEEVVEKAFGVQDLNYICPPSISQYAALAALTGPQDHVEEFRQEFERRRDVMCRRLDEMPEFFRYVKPDGAYYVFPRLSEDVLERRSPKGKAQQRFGEIQGKFQTADTAVALDLLYGAGVVAIPGIAFGPEGKGHLRFSFAAEEDDIHMAFDRMGSYWRRAA
ncbi:MAG: aminotransferase class I/II-fold pyridoxal phosphate-dependent enzyme [Candidatus Aenigmarchaeota archaeon]|nr:aminotransferase class I/II-fold pyridoxal phosphate-dependent enzyme [Candidatus Aenigmarchaeota archaeon]